MKLKNLLISVGAFALVSSFAVGLAVSHDNEMIRTEAATNTWSIIGGFTESNWATDIEFTDEDADGVGEIKLELPAGTGFKFRWNSDWGTQINGGAWTSKHGTTHFSGSGDGNIVATNAGIYTFTMSMDKVKSSSASATDISYTYAEKEINVEGTWAMIGSYTGSDWATETEFVLDETSGNYVITKELSANDEFKFRFNDSWDHSIGAGQGLTHEKLGAKGENFLALASATYKFTMSAEAYVDYTSTGSDISVALENVDETVYGIESGKPFYLEISIVKDDNNEWYTPENNWTSSGAVFYLNFGIGQGTEDEDAWSAKMTKVECAGDETVVIYETIVPTDSKGNEVVWGSVNAVRINPSAEKPSWEDGVKWGDAYHAFTKDNQDKNMIKVYHWDYSEMVGPFTTEGRATVFGKYFDKVAVCDGNGSNTITEEQWNSVKAQYDAMHADAKTIVKKTVASDAEEATDLEKSMHKYDYLVAKYADNDLADKAWMTDFIGRVEVTGANRLMTSLTNNNNMVMIIVISSVVAVLGVSVFFIYRRKRNVQ